MLRFRPLIVGTFLISLSIAYVAWAQDTSPDVTLTVQLQWPESVKPMTGYALFLAKINEDGTGHRVSKDELPKEGRYVFSHLSPGQYAVESLEGQAVGCGWSVHELFTLDAKKQEVDRAIKVSKVPITTLRVTLKPEGETGISCDGQLTFGRRPYNTVTWIVSPDKEAEIHVVADEPCAIHFKAYRQHVDAEPVGPLVPGEQKDGRVIIPVKVQMPTLRYHWTVDEADESILKKARGGICMRLDRVREDGKRDYVQSMSWVGEQFAEQKLRTGPTQRFYNLKDGTYELNMLAVSGNDPLPCAMLASKTTRFTVTDGKAEPGDLELKLDQSRLGRVTVSLTGKDGKPVPMTLVCIHEDSAGVGRGLTDVEGCVTFPKMLAGKYKVLTGGGNGLPLLLEDIQVKPGANVVLLSYAEMLTIKGIVVMSDGGTPEMFEGVAYAGMDMNNSRHMGNRTADFEMQVMPKSFPMLIVVAGPAPTATQSPVGQQPGRRVRQVPVYGAVLLDRPPTDEVRVTLSQGKRRTVTLTIPKDSQGASPGRVAVWFCRKGTVEPVGIVNLNGARAQAANQTTSDFIGEGIVPNGTWDVLTTLETEQGQRRMAWLGACVVSDEPQVSLHRGKDDVQAAGTLAEIYQIIRNSASEKDVN